MTKENQTFQVGDFTFENPLILAPMDGYSSWPFRSLCRELGSGISYTEFVKAEDVIDRPQYIKDKIYFTESERPVYLQLYGHDPFKITAAALVLQEKKPDAIDINLGCPNRSIVGRGAGAGLMLTPIKTARIFKKLSRVLNIPFTAKIRLGWQTCQNQLLIAKIIQDYGGSLIAVHARTKEQGHFGPPNLPGLAEIKNHLTIPVIGNGGVNNLHDIQIMHERTSCDGVMIGRAAIANPWIFSKKDREEIAPTQVWELMSEHLERTLLFYGTEQGLVLFRKFAASYLSPYNLKIEVRKNLLTESDPEKFKQQLGKIFSNISSSKLSERTPNSE